MTIEEDKELIENVGRWYAELIDDMVYERLTEEE